jgi:hypothetical protein
MRRQSPPRLALALLQHFVPDSSHLAGDLVEEHHRRQSRLWFWWQVLAGIAVIKLERDIEIRPLRLVDVQPADALERTNGIRRRRDTVDLSASPISGVGGLGLMLLAGVLTLVRPAMWLALISVMCAGLLLGIVLIAMHRRPGQPPTTIRAS